MPVTLRLDDVRFGYGSEDVLDGVTLALEAGQFVVLAGPNGSGKSTLVKLCVGLIQPQSGRIEVLEGSPTNPSIRRLIGYAPQGLRGATNIPVSVKEVVGAGIVPTKGLLHRLVRADWVRVERTLREVGMAELSSECLFELSGGQQQRAILARALVSDPKLILLDEPTTGIDQRLRPVVADELRRRADGGATVVVVTHDPEDFHDVVDRIVVMGEGPPTELAHEDFHLAAGRQ